MNQASSTNHIALFGTSADPPTAGHQTILKWLAQHYNLVVVWASDNPFKKHQSSLQARSEMLNLIIREIKSANNIILDQSISDRKTLLTVQKAQQIWQNAKFTVVIGADLVQQITTWYQIEKLLKQVNILIIPRPGYAIKQSDLVKLKALGGQYTIANFSPPEVSSSSYRLQGNTNIITSAVEKYIESKDLYSHNATQ